MALDVKVWEPSVITLFLALGNVFTNSIWEGLIQASKTFQADEIPKRFIFNLFKCETISCNLFKIIILVYVGFLSSKGTKNSFPSPVIKITYQ